MGIPITTPKAIREALAPLIEALTPTHENYRDLGWSYVKDDDPAGPTIRKFTIINGQPIETYGGIHGGGGIEYEYEMVIRASYGEMRAIEADDLIADDAIDLWLLMHPLSDNGGIDGLLPFRGPYQVEFYDDTEGALVVDYIYEIHYKGRD